MPCLDMATRVDCVSTEIAETYIATAGLYHLREWDGWDELLRTGVATAPKIIHCTTSFLTT